MVRTFQQTCPTKESPPSKPAGPVLYIKRADETPYTCLYFRVGFSKHTPAKKRASSIVRPKMPRGGGRGLRPRSLNQSILAEGLRQINAGRHHKFVSGAAVAFSKKFHRYDPKEDVRLLRATLIRAGPEQAPSALLRVRSSEFRTQRLFGSSYIVRI